jgi:plastocyanin
VCRFGPKAFPFEIAVPIPVQSYLSGMDRRTFLQAASGIGVAFGFAGCSGRSAPPGNDYDVGMSARRFDPAAIEVTPGTTVRWQNTSTIAHTVTAYEDRIPEGTDFFASGGFDSEAAAEDAWIQGSGGAIYQSQSFEHEFSEPGDYPYFCIPHKSDGMTGVVTVSEDAD